MIFKPSCLGGVLLSDLLILVSCISTLQGVLFKLLVVFEGKFATSLAGVNSCLNHHPEIIHRLLKVKQFFLKFIFLDGACMLEGETNV